MSYSSDYRVPSLVHQACHSLIPPKSFLRKHKDLSRMISKPDAVFFWCFLWFSALEITKILFRISFRIFWSSNLSWIGASFSRCFSILCCLFGCFSLVLSFYPLDGCNCQRPVYNNWNNDLYFGLSLSQCFLFKGSDTSLSVKEF